MRKLFLFFCGAFLLVNPSGLSAQFHHEFIAQVNYQSFAYTRLDSFPNVIYIYDNTAYDQNNKRFFFQGNHYQSTPPWTLYTVDAQTGGILMQASLPSNLSSSSHVGALQYDNSSDTLYGVYFLGATFSSCWIEPASGIVHIKQLLPGADGYAPGISTYDEINHRLIFWGSTSNGGRLIVVDARTGTMLSASQLSSSGGVCDIEYNNTTNHLYGVRTGTTSLDSIEVLTGVQHPIRQLPSMGLMQNGISFIDEPNHVYVFCGKTQPSNNDSLFTIDLQTGSIVNEQTYGSYANSASITGENIIFYCMDQLNGQLYALNWGIDYGPESVNETNEAGTFSIYPDPASYSTDILFPRNFNNAEVRLYNSQGKLIRTSETVQSDHLQLFVGNLAQGIYSVTVTGDNGFIGVKHLIVQ